jgi:hypothetical protein
MLIQIDIMNEFEWMGIKIDRYNLAHCTKYKYSKSPKHLPLPPPTGYETSCVAGWSELELASLLTLRSELNVLKICVMYVCDVGERKASGSDRRVLLGIL